MARSKRLVTPGMPHHIVQRGNRRLAVFGDDYDRMVFLRLLADSSREHGLNNNAYCLMTNHEHFISVPEREDSIALAMHDLLGP
jgi:putative transposase